VLASTYQSTDSPLLSTLYEPLPKHLISVLVSQDPEHERPIRCRERLGGLLKYYTRDAA
jgi:hypothetical protein